MSWTRTAAIAATTLAAALPIAACGGDDSESFKEDYNAIGNELKSVTSDLGSTGDPSALGDQLNKVADKADEARKKLADLDPPEDAQDEFDALVADVDKFVDAMRAVADAASKGDVQALQESATNLQKTGQEMIDAENKLAEVVNE